MGNSGTVERLWFADKAGDLDYAFATGRADARADVEEPEDWLAIVEHVTGLHENWEAEIAFWLWLRPYLWELVPRRINTGGSGTWAAPVGIGPTAPGAALVGPW